MNKNETKEITKIYIVYGCTRTGMSQNNQNLYKEHSYKLSSP